MSDAPVYGRSFDLWRAYAPQTWHNYTQHSFVTQLADGSLPKEAFLHYLAQDYVFLIHFSRAWALAVVKSETLAEMRTAASTVNALVNHELQLHVEICANEGICEAELFQATESQANLAYTRYVLDAGFSGDFLDLMAALAPCVHGYGEIGQRLGKLKTSTPYQAWIDTYADSEYQSLCKLIGEMTDNALVYRLGDTFETTPRWQHLCKRFATATKLEVDFWQMGLDRT